MSVGFFCACARGIGAMNTATPSSPAAIERAKRYRTALAQQQIQNEIAGFGIRTFRSSDSQADHKRPRDRRATRLMARAVRRSKCYQTNKGVTARLRPP